MWVRDGRPGFSGVDGGLVLAGDGPVRQLQCLPRTRATIRSSSGAGPWSAAAVPALAGAVRVGGVRLWLSRLLPAWLGVGGPLLVPGIASLQLLTFGRHLPGEGAGAGRAGLVVAGLGVGGLGERVGFGLSGEPQLAAHVWRGDGLDAFCFEDAGFECAAGHAADDICLVAVSPGRGS